MRRPNASTRYDILTSAEAWSLIGTLDAVEFAEVQAEIEKLAWTAFNLRSTQGGTARLNVPTARVGMVCEVDHVARRVTVLSLQRGQGRNRLAATDGEAENPAEHEARASGGAGNKR